MQGNYGNGSMQGMQSANAGYYTAKKQLPCPYEGCDQLFTCKHNVDQHIRERHTLERPQVCQLCVKFTAFTRPASLYRHQRMVHNYQPDVGPRGRPRGPQGPRKNKRGVRRNDAARPVPSENRININNYPNVIQEIPQTTAPDVEYCFTCFQTLPAGLEARLIHGHLAHNDKCNPSCSCSLCVEHFPRQVPEQQPDRPQIITSTLRDLNNSLLNQPFIAKQLPAIQQPKPIRTLDLNTLNALDEKLKRVQATQSHQPGPSRMNGVESSGASDAQRAEVDLRAAPPNTLDLITLNALDEKLRRVQAFQSPQPGASRMIGMKSSVASDAQQAKAEMETRPDSGIGFDQDFEMREFTDFASKDFVNDDQGDGNVAAGGMVE